MATEKIWITSDLPESHTALWDPDKRHEGNEAHLRGGQTAEVVLTDSVKAQLAAEKPLIRKATDAEVEAAKKARKIEAKEAQVAP